MRQLQVQLGDVEVRARAGGVAGMPGGAGVAYLAEDVEVRRLGHCRFTIDRREVDFGPVAAAAPVVLPVPGDRRRGGTVG